MSTIADLRSQFPDILEGKTDFDVVQMLSEDTRLPMPYVAYELGLSPKDYTQNTGFGGDLGTDLAIGTAELGQAGAGFANILLTPFSDEPVFTTPGLDEYIARQNALYSPGRQESMQQVQQAWDTGDWTDVVGAYLSNPGDAILGTAVRSLPSSIGGGLGGLGLRMAARGATSALGRAVGTAAPYVGEGGVMAGGSYQQMVEGGADPTDAALYGLGIGALGAGIAGAGGSVARRFGVTDPERALAGVRLPGEAPTPSWGRRLGGGALLEGAEEALQSPMEQMGTNLATGEDLTSGVARATLEGALAGGLMGAGFNIMPRRREIDLGGKPVDLLKGDEAILASRTVAGEPLTADAVADRAGVREPLGKAGLEQRAAGIEEAFNEPSGVFVTDPATGMERELTQGERYEQIATGVLPNAVAQRDKVVAASRSKSKTPVEEKPAEHPAITALRNAYAATPPAETDGFLTSTGKKLSPAFVQAFNKVKTQTENLAGEALAAELEKRALDLQSSKTKHAPHLASALTMWAAAERAKISQPAATQPDAVGTAGAPNENITSVARPEDVGAQDGAPGVGGAVPPIGGEVGEAGSQGPVSLSGRDRAEEVRGQEVQQPVPEGAPGVVTPVAPTPAPAPAPATPRARTPETQAVVNKAQTGATLEAWELEETIRALVPEVLNSPEWQRRVQRWVRVVPKLSKSQQKNSRLVAEYERAVFARNQRIQKIKDQLVEMMVERRSLGKHTGGQPRSYDTMAADDFVQRDATGKPVIANGTVQGLADSWGKDNTWSFQTLYDLDKSLEKALVDRGVNFNTLEDAQEAPPVDEIVQAMMNNAVLGESTPPVDNVDERTLDLTGDIVESTQAADTGEDEGEGTDTSDPWAGEFEVDGSTDKAGRWFATVGGANVSAGKVTGFTLKRWAELAGYDTKTDPLAARGQALKDIKALPQDYRHLWNDAVGENSSTKRLRPLFDALRAGSATTVPTIGRGGVVPATLRLDDKTIESLYKLAREGVEGAPALGALTQDENDLFTRASGLTFTGKQRILALREVIKQIVEGRKNANNVVSQPASDAATTESARRGAGGAATTREAGAGVGQESRGPDTGTGEPVVTSAGAKRVAEVAVSTKRRRVAAPPQEGDVQQGVGQVANPTTVSRLRETISSVLGNGSHWRLHLYDDIGAALADGHTPRKIGDAYGWVERDKNGVKHAYLIVDRIEQGTELGKFLHEVGAHIGMENILPPALFKNLVGQVRQWGARTSDSQESRIARAALARVEEVNQSRIRQGRDPLSQDSQDRELIAYFVEEAVRDGVDPTAVQAGTPIGAWFHKLWAAFKTALRKARLMNLESLRSQHIVDLAYGAARMDLTTYWHGTKEPFRKFDSSYMSSGAGGQWYARGHYIAQLKGVGKHYMDMVTRGKTDQLLFDGKPVNDILWDLNDPTGAEYTVGIKVRAFEKFVHSILTDISNGKSLADAIDYRIKYYTEWLREPRRVTASPKYIVEVGKEILRIAKEDGHRFTVKPAPKGALMRVDVNVMPDEIMHWNLPLSKQPKKVRDALASKLISGSLEKDGVLRLGKGSSKIHISNNTKGNELYGRLSAVLAGDEEENWRDWEHQGSEDASMWLNDLGIKAMQHWDEPSQKKVADAIARKNDIDLNALTTNLVVFDDKNIRRIATGPSGDVSPDALQYGFAGIGATTADLMALSTAEQRLAAGEDAETVRKETGWFKGKDGKWRFEISDREAKLNEAVFANGDEFDVTLGELLDHPKLFAAYPFMQYVGVKIVTDPYGKAQASYGDHSIKINANSKDSVLSALLHEIQHAIQHNEGFAKGGNAAFAFSHDPKNFMKLYNDLAEVVYTPMSIEAFAKSAYQTDTITDEIRKEYADYERSVKKSKRQGQYDNDIQWSSANEWYRRLYGESEARLVQERQNLTEEQRRNTPIAYDVPYEDLIVRMNGVDMENAPIPQNLRAEPQSIQYGIAEAVRNELDTAPTQTARAALLGWMTIDQMAERYGKNLPILKDISKTFGKISANTKHWLNRASHVIRMWDGLAKAQTQLMHDVMGRATHAGFDPDKETPSKPEHQEILDKWNQLNVLDTTAKVKAVDVYRAARQYYKDDLKESIDSLKALKANADPDEAQRFDKLVSTLEALQNRTKGVYFPLMRFGDHYMVAMSPEMRALHERSKTPDGLTPAEEKRYSAMRKDRKHYLVQGFDSERAAKRAAKRHETQGMQVTTNVGRYTPEAARTSIAPDMKAFEAMLGDIKLPAGAADSLRNAYEDLLIEALPENHPLKRQLSRDGVAGWDQDMRRVFAKSTQSRAFALSRLMHVRTLQEQIAALDKAGEMFEPDAQLAKTLGNELKMQQDLVYTRTEDPAWVRWATGFNYMSMLGFSPAFWFLNLMQVPTITLPWLSARNGNRYQETFRVLTKAWGQSAKLVKWSTEGKEWSAELDLTRNANLTDEEKQLLTDLQDAGKLQFTIGQDLGQIAEGRSDAMAKLVRTINAPTHATELINRTATALAAYRVSKAKQAGLTRRAGESDADFKARVNDAATEFAINAVDTTQVNMDPSSTARNMKVDPFFKSSNVARILFQFWKFQQGMAYLSISTLRDALRSKDHAVRKQARDTAVGMSAMLIFTSGVFGLPFLGTGLSALSFLLSGLGPDDEDEDLERDLKNFFHDNLPEPVAKYLNKGIWGVLNGPDLSARFSMGNLMNPLAYARFEGQQRGEDTLKEIIFRVFGGATGANAAAALDGLDALWDGDFSKAGEKLLPVKFLRDLSKATTMSTEGLSTGKGEQRLDPNDFSVMDPIWQAMGVIPMRKSRYYEQQAAIQGPMQAVNSARQKLMADYGQARIKGQDVSSVMRDIYAFNRRNPQAKITFEQLQQWVKRRRENARATLPSGVLANKQTKPYTQYARWAE